MKCAQPEGVMKQERDYLTALKGAQQYLLDARGLLINYDQGKSGLKFNPAQ
jgi:heat shock protein HslJ